MTVRSCAMARASTKGRRYQRLFGNSAMEGWRGRTRQADPSGFSNRRSAERVEAGDVAAGLRREGGRLGAAAVGGAGAAGIEGAAGRRSER